MEQWNFYFSGILYGIFYETDGAMTLSRLNVHTAGLEAPRPVRKEDWDFFQVLCSRDLSGFFADRAEYEAALFNEPDSFILKDGSRFTRRRRESYIQRGKKFPLDLSYDRNSAKGQRIFAVSMTGRDYCAVLVKDGREKDTVLARWEEAFPGNSSQKDGKNTSGICGVSFAGTFFVPTRDGERLATDVYLPVIQTASTRQTDSARQTDSTRRTTSACQPGSGSGEDAINGAKAADRQVPAVLIRTPYGKGVGKEGYYRFVQRGYAVVIQDTRGREDSTGVWQPNYYEVEDGDDTLNWIAAQPWSDGSVSMTGGSYLGYVQWAAAASGNPHLKALLSFVCAGSAFTDLPRRGGCFTSGMLAWAFSMSEQRMKKELMEQENWDEILDYRPLSKLPQMALGRSMPFVEEWLAHPDLDEFWKMSSWKDRYKGRPVPALIVSGWFDDNGMGTTEALDLVSNWPKGTWKAVLGPWKHSGNADYDLHGNFMGENALRYDIDLLCLKWLEHFLKGKENGIEKTPAVEYYTLSVQPSEANENGCRTWQEDAQAAMPGSGVQTGAQASAKASVNCWKTADAWPAGSVPAVLYLAGDANAGTQAEEIQLISPAAGTGSRCGTGGLWETPDNAEGLDQYLYDPNHPSFHIIDMSENELEVPEDYTEEEKRSDVLSYSTGVLSHPLTVSGDFLVRLFVSCDCPDTDFVVRITDVDENGRSVKLADGLLCARYRNGFEKPEFMEPGQVYEIKIRTTKLSYTFLPGHRMRLTVTSSAKNFIFPNSNTKNGFDSLEMETARVQIHRGGMYPSCVQFFEEPQPELLRKPRG